MKAPAPPRLLLAGAARLQFTDQTLPLAERDAALLAWLALEGPTPRARLVELLWPGGEPAAARNSLRQRLFKLRKQAGADLVAGSELLSLAPGIGHDLQDSSGVLGDAMLGFGGDLPAWLERQRGLRRARLRDGLAAQAAAAQAAQDWPTALRLAQQALALEPLSEAAHRRLMQLHYLAGDRAAALLAFDRCAAVLKDEVGALPSEDTLALLRAVQQSGPPAAALLPLPRQAAAVLRLPRLVGREDAWRALNAAWSMPPSVPGRAVLLVAEGGVGKTRLASDFAAQQGACITGARPGDEAVAYASLSRLLRALPPAHRAALAPPLRAELARLLPELGAPPPPLAGDEGRARFANAVTQALAGLSLVFDDLHFADAASVELLRLALAAGASRWLLATRPQAGCAAAAALAAEWVGTGGLLLPLLPLTPAQVAEMLQTLDLPGVDPERDAPALFRRSGGNPLILLETLKTGWREGEVAATLPAMPGVMALIQGRIGQLSMPAVQLARCAALAAPDFSIELAAHVLALRTIDLADPWAELEAAQVLVDGAFAHDLIFEAARASVPAPVAQQLHAEIAAFLAQRGGEAARLAQHWEQAQRWPEAGAAWSAAALRARQAGRALEAAAHYAQSAAAWQRAANGSARFAALVERADLLCSEQPDEQARQAVVELHALATGADQQLRTLEMQFLLASNRHDSAEVAAAGPAALLQARASGDIERELRLAILVSDALADRQRPAEGVALLQPYAEAVRGVSGELQWEYWNAQALALDYAGRLREALLAWDQARAVALREQRHDHLWKTAANTGSTMAKLGYVRRAAEAYGQACATAEALGDHTLRAMQTRTIWAHRLRDSGRYDEALALLLACREAFAAGGSEADRAAVEHRLSQLYQQLGQPERAAHLLAAERPELPPRLQTVRQMHRADLAFEVGGTAREGQAEALRLIRQALALSPGDDDIYHRMASLFATRIVPPDEGEAMATSLAAWASARERLGLALAAHVRAAGCALRLDAPRRAQPHAQAALHLAREFEPDSFYLPELWLVAGQVEQALGREDAARALWRTGADWVRGTARVPANFSDSFLQRQVVNRVLLPLATTAG